MSALITGTGPTALRTFAFPDADASVLTSHTKVTPAQGGTGADLSATGGTGQVLKQVSAGAAVTVGLVADADLSTSDVTTNNVSTSKHGFAPKAPNDATKFLDGTGAYSVPPGTGGGKFSLAFTPGANEPPSSGYMTLNVRNGHLVLEATAGNTDTAIFSGVIPWTYAGGNLTVYLEWMAKTATSGTIGWDVTFERNNGAVDLTADHWATAQAITAATVPGSAGTNKITSVAITAGAAGTASLAAGDPFRLRVRRLSSDSATGNAQLLSVSIQEA